MPVADATGIGEGRRIEVRGEWFGLLPHLPMPAALVRTGDWQIVKVNAAFAQIFGYTVDEAERLTVMEVTHPDDRTAAGQRLSALVQGTLSQYHLERRFLAKDGRVIPVDLSVGAVRNEAGTLEGLLCLMTDISERQSVQEERRQAQISAEAAIRAKNEFLATMSHELRTPLNAISGLTHLTLQTMLDPGQRDNLQRIQEACRDLLRVVNDVLDFSRMELGTLTLERFPFDLRELLGKLVGRFESRAEEKGLAWRCHVDPGIPERLIGDGGRLMSVLEHLLENAVKFTGQGTVGIEIHGTTESTSDADCRVQFSVSDTGIGISEAQIETLTAPFTQGDGTYSRRFGGIGIGLSIVRKLLTLMGTTLEIDSRPGNGSRFRFSLGFQKAPAVAKTLAEQLNRLHGARVLVVEDSPINQKIARSMLERYGIRVELAGNGLQGLEAVRREPFDFVLMDLEMPEMNGFEATRQIRTLPGREELPIVAMTGHRLSDDRGRIRDAGMNDGMEKPLAANTMASMLLRWIPSKPRSRQANGGPMASEMRKSPVGLPGHLPGIDLRGSLERLENNQSLLISLLCEFREQHAGLVKECEELLAAGNLVEVKHQIHALKGVAANLGLIRVHRVGLDLEEALSEGNTPRVGELVRSLQDGLEEAFTSIERLNLAADGSPTITAFDKQTVGHLVKTLSGQLATRNLGALESFAELEKAVPPCPELEAVRKILRRLDFPGANAALERLIPILGLPETTET